MSEAEPQRAYLEVDFDEIRGFIDVACRRVSAFLRLGLDELDAKQFADFNLSANMHYRFWPDNLAPDAIEDVKVEYRAWVVHCGLRELDQIYNLFLDRVWWAIELGDLHGSEVALEHMFDQKFSRITNVAKKQEQIAARLGIDDYFEELNSLSLARNCLAHNAGGVRAPVDCNNAERDHLAVKWLAFETVLSRGGVEHIMTAVPFDTNDLPGEGETTVTLRMALREVVFPARTRLLLTYEQLAELCMFYKIVGEKVITGLMAFFKAKGIGAGTVGATEEPEGGVLPSSE